METLAIPKARQLEAIADGFFMTLLAEFVSDPTAADIRRYISVTRQELRAYLHENSFAVRRVLARARCDSLSRSRFCIDYDESKYLLYWLDKGAKRFGQEYKSAVTVVVDYLWKEHGLA